MRNMLRIMLALATLRSRKRHLSLLILTSDSAHIGELNIFLELQEFLVLLIQHSKVLMYLRVYSPECTPMIRVMSGVDIVHHLVMSTPSTARSVVLHSSTATVELARSMFMVTMVTTEILELLATVRIGGGAESSSVTPPADKFLTVNGTAASKFTHLRGRPDGSPRLFGTPDLVLRFNIFTNPVVASSPSMEMQFLFAPLSIKVENSSVLICC